MVFPPSSFMLGQAFQKQTIKICEAAVFMGHTSFLKDAQCQ